jgi:hypothetical protein
MLKKPYQLLLKKEINRYYLLPLPDSNMVAVETVMTTRGLFGKEKEFSVALDMIPINSGLLATFLEFIKVKPIGEKKITDDMPSEKLYPSLNIKPIREKLKKITKNMDTNFNYHGIPSNDTVKSLLEEGYQMLGVQTIGSHAREVWLIKTNDFGTLHVLRVFLHGKNTVDSVGFAKLNLFDQELVKKILEKITNKKFMEESND